MCKHCWGGETEHHKDFVRGGVKVDDFDEPRFRHPKRKKTKTKVKTRAGCPANEYRAHVYVWTTEREVGSFFSDYFGFPEYQSRICAGCGKKSGYKNSEAYEKRKAKEWAKHYGGEFKVERGKPLSRWGRRQGPSYKYYHWENQIPEYREARHEYMKRHGWNDYLYGRLY